MHRRCACPSRGRPGDDAEASVSRTASNLPATKPHIATASTVSVHCDLCAEQRGYEVTRGKVVGRERLARNGMQGVRGSNPLSSTPGQRPNLALTGPESPASRSRFAAMRAVSAVTFGCEARSKGESTSTALTSVATSRPSCCTTLRPVDGCRTRT
jgi:hypothetical protein